MPREDCVASAIVGGHTRGCERDAVARTTSFGKLENGAEFTFLKTIIVHMKQGW